MNHAIDAYLSIIPVKSQAKTITVDLDRITEPYIQEINTLKEIVRLYQALTKQKKALALNPHSYAEKYRS